MDKKDIQGTEKQFKYVRYVEYVETWAFCSHLKDTGGQTGKNKRPVLIFAVASVCTPYQRQSEIAAFSAPAWFSTQKGAVLF